MVCFIRQLEDDVVHLSWLNFDELLLQLERWCGQPRLVKFASPNLCYPNTYGLDQLPSFTLKIPGQSLSCYALNCPYKRTAQPSPPSTSHPPLRLPLLCLNYFKCWNLPSISNSCFTSRFSSTALFLCFSFGKMILFVFIPTFLRS